MEKKSIEQLNRKDDDGNGESVFQGQYMKMWDNIDQVYNNIYILIFLGFIFGTRVNKNRATISPIGLGRINSHHIYVYVYLIYVYMFIFRNASSVFLGQSVISSPGRSLTIWDNHGLPEPTRSDIKTQAKETIS